MAEALSQRVAATVRAEMARRQVKQAALATVLGISVAQVSERLLGRTPFRLDELDLVADMLRVPVATFVSERGESPASAA